MMRSFRTLELFVRNLHLLAEMDANKDQAGEPVMERHRREALPTPSDNGSEPNPDDGQAPAPAQPYLGPYPYPMFSGKPRISIDHVILPIHTGIPNSSMKETSHDTDTMLHYFLIIIYLYVNNKIHQENPSEQLKSGGKSLFNR